MADIVRYGVLSTAGIAVNRHVPSAQGADNTEIAAIASRDLVKAEKWAAELGIGATIGMSMQMLGEAVGSKSAGTWRLLGRECRRLD